MPTFPAVAASQPPGGRSLVQFVQPGRDLLCNQSKGTNPVLDVAYRRGEHQLVGAGALEQVGQLSTDRFRGADCLCSKALPGELPLAL